MNTFKLGGIHPEENKLAKNSKVEVCPLPKKAVVFVSQHLGTPSVPVVRKGDRVKTGQLLAKAEAFICANTHSPFTGVITKIDLAKDFNAYAKLAFYIDVEEDEWEEGIDVSDEIVREIKLNPAEIVEKIKDKGIVGLGGAAFPTHVKYMIQDGRKAEYLIINAVECEPYLTSDNRVLIERTEEVLIGIQIMKKALGVNIAKIGIEKNKPEAIERIRTLAKSFDGIEIVPLKTKYPQGAEKQLVYALTKREVPSGKLPIDVGCVVNNVGTAWAVYDAVQKNRPLIDNVLTYTGKNVKESRNLLVRVGTSLREVVEYCGGLPEHTGKIINGGPMMGKAIVNLDAPTVKTTSCILIMDEKESKRKKQTNCLRCGKCVSACPMGLEPIQLALLAKQSRWEEAEKECAMDCIECGCCLYTCPASQPLLDLIRVAKINIGKLRRERSKK